MKKEKALKSRQCALTREVKPVGEMVRFVLSPEGQVVPDVAGKLPGRGVWIDGKNAFIEQAVKKGAFARGFKQKVKLEEDLPSLTADLLKRAALGQLKMANKVGALVFGFTKIMSVLDVDDMNKGLIALVHSDDAAADGAGKIDRKFKAVFMGSFEEKQDKIRIFQLPVQDLLQSLGANTGKHIGLKHHPCAEGFVKAMERFHRFKGKLDDKKG